MPATPARLAIGVLAALAALSPAPVNAATASVNVGDSFFDPQTTVIEVGSSVVWTQTGNAPHSVTADDGSFDSHPQCLSVPGACMRNGETYTRVFEEPGIFPYYCKVHSSPGGSGMNGVVKVVDETRVTPTTITRLDATPAAGSVSVSGHANFGGQNLVRLATDPEGDSLARIREADLVEAKMGQLNPMSGDVNFVFEVADLPVDGGIPEVISYWWYFALDSAVFSIQGQFHRTTEAQLLKPWFLLHICDASDCRTNRVTGTMVGSDNEIIVDIPWTLLETAAGGSLAGDSIVPDAGGIVTEFDMGLVLPADEIATWAEYPIAHPRVDIGIAAPGGIPAATVAANVATGGDFAASLDTAGFAPGPYDVVTRACFGTNCATSRRAISI